MAKPAKHQWSWMLPKEEVPIIEERAEGGGIGTALWMLIGAAAIAVAVVVIVPSLPSGPPKAGPAAATSAPASTPRPTMDTSKGGGGGGSGGASSSLPLCSTIQDSTTACQGTPGELPAGAPEQAQEQPTPTLELAPAAIECWQGSFYTCDELAEMGEQEAIEAVQQTDTFVDIQTLPTPAPAFVEYATDACAKAETKSILCP